MKCFTGISDIQSLKFISIYIRLLISVTENVSKYDQVIKTVFLVKFWKIVIIKNTQVSEAYL